jgi:hypothetical protein
MAARKPKAKSSCDGDALHFLSASLPLQTWVDQLLRALDPRACSDKQWNGLLAALGDREKLVAKQEHPSNDLSHAGSDAAEWRSRRAVAALELPGEEGRIALTRFAQTFGSPRWLEWARAGMLNEEDKVSGLALPRLAAFAQHVINRMPSPAAPELHHLLRVWFERTLEIYPSNRGRELAEILLHNVKKDADPEIAFPTPLLEQALAHGRMPLPGVAIAERLLLARASREASPADAAGPGAAARGALRI